MLILSDAYVPSVFQKRMLYPEIKEPLVSPGVDAVRTKDRFDENRSITLAMAAEYTLEANQPEKLKASFVDAPTLKKIELECHDCVITHIPTGKYSPVSIQIIAVREEVARGLPIELVDGRVPVRSIYDFPDVVQFQYFYQTVAGYHAVRQAFAECTEEKFQVLFTENAAFTVSNEQYRVARTIAEPHIQIWVVRGESLAFDPAKIPRLLKFERRIITQLKAEIGAGMTALMNDINQLIGDAFSFDIRTAPPYGYVVHTPIHAQMPLAQQAELLNTVMKAHHLRYVAESTRIINKLIDSGGSRFLDILLPQPSYKVYGTFSDTGMLELSFAPSLFASAGVVEGLDRQIYRSPDNIPLFPNPEAELAYYESVARKLA
ncbi:hypothetical protein KA078_00480 [Candidatus Woesebacteria bacterium]|nr:hypothetical protein [Candidatus Woesebacteria bacterium]